MSLVARWSGVLDDLRGQGRYRSLRLPAGVDFTSNDYLGYGRLVGWVEESEATTAHQPRDSVGRRRLRLLDPPYLPTSGTSSRLLRGHHAIWEEVESSLASWHGADAVLMMTSGYAANEGLLSTILESGDWVAADELVHASIIDGLRLSRPRKFRFRHNDLNHLEEGLKASRKRQRPEGSQLFVITESLFSMDGDRAPLADIVALTEKYGAHIIVDEAHTTGCNGPAGSGSVDAAGLRSRVLATIHTGGKSVGVMGAYVCGSRLLKEYLVNRCRHLIFTTAVPPVVGAWWLDALDRVSKDHVGRRRLHENAQSFRAKLAALGVDAAGTEYVVPVVLGEDARAVRAAGVLQERGFDVRAIRPPSVPAGTARLRISIHADHDPGVLDRLAAAVAEAVRS